MHRRDERFPISERVSAARDMVWTAHDLSGRSRAPKRALLDPEQFRRLRLTSAAPFRAVAREANHRFRENTALCDSFTGRDRVAKCQEKWQESRKSGIRLRSAVAPGGARHDSRNT